MLQLRPTCEQCNKALPANAADAMICSYECTFCKDCVTDVLLNVCPNCGGGFMPRPIRPSNDLRNGNCLANNPASTDVVYAPVDVASHHEFAKHIKDVPPNER